jgi:hypothetical protein
MSVAATGSHARASGSRSGEQYSRRRASFGSALGGRHNAFVTDTYDLIRAATLARRQVVATYKGHPPRALPPCARHEGGAPAGAVLPVRGRQLISATAGRRVALHSPEWARGCCRPRRAVPQQVRPAPPGVSSDSVRLFVPCNKIRGARPPTCGTRASRTGGLLRGHVALPTLDARRAVGTALSGTTVAALAASTWQEGPSDQPERHRDRRKERRGRDERPVRSRANGLCAED